MKLTKILKLSVLGLVALFLSSCLTVEKKEYTFEFTGANSGKLTIRYINIMSVMDNENDVSAGDFEELLSNYINGDQIAQDYPGATNVKTRLYEQNGLLCGEVTMDFPSLSAARLYQYDKNSPLMLSIGAALDSESYSESNGSYGGDFMPVVFWPGNSKKLTLTTSVSSPDDSSLSLVNEFRKWKAGN